MTLSPFEIERQEFGRSPMGYKPREVDAFLGDMHRSVSTLWQERADLREENERLKERLTRFEQIEDQLKNTLLLAQDSAEKACEQARRESDLIMREAGQRARDIVHTAHEERQRLELVLRDLHSAEQEARQRLRALTQTVLSHLDDTENLVSDGASNLRAIVQAHPDPFEQRGMTGAITRADAGETAPLISTAAPVTATDDAPVATPAATPVGDASETTQQTQAITTPSETGSNDAELRITRRAAERARRESESGSEVDNEIGSPTAEGPKTDRDESPVEAGSLAASIAADTTGRSGLARTATADAFFDEPPSFDLSAFAPHSSDDDE